MNVSNVKCSRHKLFICEGWSARRHNHIILWFVVKVHWGNQLLPVGTSPTNHKILYAFEVRQVCSRTRANFASCSTWAWPCAGRPWTTPGPPWRPRSAAGWGSCSAWPAQTSRSRRSSRWTGWSPGSLGLFETNLGIKLHITSLHVVDSIIKWSFSFKERTSKKSTSAYCIKSFVLTTNIFSNPKRKVEGFNHGTFDLFEGSSGRGGTIPQK